MKNIGWGLVFMILYFKYEKVPELDKKRNTHFLGLLDRISVIYDFF